MIRVIDASVALKWIVEEANSELALEVLRRSAGGPGTGDSLIAPEFVLIEIANVLRRKVGAGEIAEGQAHEAMRSVPSLFHDLVGAAELSEQALRIAIELNHPALDCSYLACALAADAVLVTADEKFIAKCSRGGYRDRVCDLKDAAA